MGAKKVLLVEDEPAIAELLLDFLEAEGYQVTVATNGQEGWERLSEIQPDVVLTDVMMPLLDGRQLCNNINRDPHYRSIPVVLMSAAREDNCRSGCDCAAFLPKPFALEQVADTIGTVTRLTRVP